MIRVAVDALARIRQVRTITSTRTREMFVKNNLIKKENYEVVRNFKLPSGYLLNSEF